MNIARPAKAADGNGQATALEATCEFIRGVTFDTAETSPAQTPTGVPILRAGNIQNEIDFHNDLLWVPPERVSPNQLLRPGDIVVCMSSGSASVVGKTCQVRRHWRGSVGAFCGIIRPRDPCDSDFLANWLRSPSFTAWRDAQARGANIQNLRFSQMAKITLPWPSQSLRRRIAARLDEQLAAVAEARAALQAQTETLDTLTHAVIRESLSNGKAQPSRFADCLHEVTQGIGDDWRGYPVLGATRAGLAPAKEAVGKSPGRYKPVHPGTIFYNPMRILLGSIAMLDEGDKPGITSPDYVVMTAVPGRLSPRWFYYWFRSRYGAEFIKSMTRGAVRERLMFKRLAPTTLLLPEWRRQQAADTQLAAITQAKARLADKLAALDHLPAALLRQAFAGRL
jgi:type I restriction enzyme S subunit